MTTKVLSVSYPGGYSLKSAYYGLDITAPVSIGGTGVLVGQTGSVENFGTVAATVGHDQGLYMQNAGTVSNGGWITGYVGVETHSAGARPVYASIGNAGYIGGTYAGVKMDQVGYVSNFGSIHGARYGVDLVSYGSLLNLGTVSAGGTGLEVGAHGSVCNGLGGRTGYEISGTEVGLATVGAAARVINYATITGDEMGVYLGHSGVLANGTASDPYASIRGATGVLTNGAAAVVANSATITGTGGAGDFGVSLSDGGQIYNYAHAAIVGFSGVSDGLDGGVHNYGLIEGLGADSGSYGVVMPEGGSLYNGGAYGAELAVIRGYSGVIDKVGAATITNYGSIQATGKYAVALDLLGGRVVNGDAKEKGAVVTGGTGITFRDEATVLNQGSIVGATGFGVAMALGGYVLNGAASNKTALISGGSGALVAYFTTTVVNFGVVESSGAYLAAIYEGFGGEISNGSGADRTARISGSTGVRSEGYTVTIASFGTIAGTGLTNSYGVYMGDGGSLTNGSVGVTSALVQGYGGVDLVVGGTVTNLGTVRATAFADTAGVGIGAGEALVVNGSAKDLTALIAGAVGVNSEATSATVKNFATISGADVGVRMGAGAVTNGSGADRTALIEGYSGLELQAGGGAAANFGSIVGVGATFGYGVEINLNDQLTNGSASDGSALISGHIGVSAYSGSTVTNFGTIEGTGGVAVQLTSPGARLVVEAGSKFIGQVYGDGGSLVLASGTGKLSGLFTNGDVTVSGSMPSTTFTDFDSLTIAAGATFTDKTAATITFQSVDAIGTLDLGGAGKNSVVNAGLIETTGAGTLTIVGALTNSGVIAAKGGAFTVDGAVSGAGSATIAGGTLDLAAAFAQNVTFTGLTGELELGQSQGYTGTISEFSKTRCTSLDLLDIKFVSPAEATYSGTKTGGVLTVTDGTSTAHIALKGNYMASAWIASGDGNGGTIVIDPTAGPSIHPMISAMAALGASDGAAARTFDASRIPGPLIARPHVDTT